ncbi:Rossmann-fold NAD(P)-binding domain-containing protein [Dongia deserti]|uniref:UDP-glucose/GDP-mannose dehydrogenase family protein n=1 Tax=Dongia deserti TaxID=2268030 RepID=UPI000E65AB20|nr:UDP-glucose/GDP-mannose dehydrogenase family protein [Dongia deserti]
MQVSVFGLDYVGSVAAGCLASQGHEVIAVDPDADKVAMIRRAVAPVNEPGLSLLIKEAVGAQRLRATTDVAEAIAGSSLTSICSGTTDRHTRPDLSLILSLCEEIGVALREKTKFHAIVLRSPVRPGTVRDFILPALERASSKRVGVDFGIGIYPQFLRRGNAMEDYLNPPAIILGVTDDETLARLRELDIALEAPEIVVELDEAEAMLHANLRSAAPARSRPEPAWRALPAMA